MWTRKVLTLGTFDVPHMGHSAFLQRCQRYGNVTVGVNSDRYVLEYRGKPPVFTFDERRALLKAAGWIVAENDSPGWELIQLVNPDILVIGSDWARRDYYAQIGTTIDQFEEFDIDLVYVPYTDGISTTLIRERCG